MLREPRSRLVAVYTALVGLVYLLPALPGGIDYPSDGAYALSIVVSAVLIVYIAKGSRTAAAVPLVLNLLGLVGLLLSVSSDDLTAPVVVAFALLLVAQSALLLRLLFWPRGAH